MNVTKEEAQKQVEACVKEFQQIVAGVGSKVEAEGIMRESMLGFIAVAKAGRLSVPIEAYMAAFARVYTGSMATAVGALRQYLDTSTAAWFDVTDPKPTQARLNAQFGVHVEEVAEMLLEVRSNSEPLNDKIALAKTLLEEIGNEFKSGASIYILNLGKFHDSIGDQVVTGTGVGKLSFMNFSETVARIEWSNFTKFINGVAQYKDGGKVAKGPYWEEARAV